MLLASRGVRGGTRAAAYRSAKPIMEQYGGEVVEDKSGIDGNIGSAGGCRAPQYLAGWVIERLVGRAISEAVITSCQPVGEGLRFETDVEAIMVPAV